MIMETNTYVLGNSVYTLADGEVVWFGNLDDIVNEISGKDEEIPFCDELDGFEVCEDCDLCAEEEPPMWGIPDVRRIIFSDPATIVFWEDGTKTVVKCMKGEKFERYAGFAMACMKKMFGSTSRAKAIMEDSDEANWETPQKEEQPASPTPKANPKAKSITLDELISAFTSAVKSAVEGKGETEEKENEAPAV